MSNRRIQLVAGNFNKEMKGQILLLSLNANACRVVQKLIETIGVEEQLQIYCEIKYSVDKMVDDINANHVIQKFIEKVPHSSIDYIAKYFVNNVILYTGICYVQALFWVQAYTETD